MEKWRELICTICQILLEVSWTCATHIERRKCVQNIKTCRDLISLRGLQVDDSLLVECISESARVLSSILVDYGIK